ncbi:MAG: hypothetical protein GDA44_07400 [Prochloron sp. SP5CPC1]|nr:hypothetical protein [Candidatus Paraprochloron terpiosi SP5CPC1]
MKKLAQITYSLSLGATLVLVFSGGDTFAQTAADLNGVGTYPANERDSFSSSSGFNPFDLIHNARFGNRISVEEFNQNTQESLDNAAADFKLQQQRRLLNQQSQSNPNSTLSVTNDLVP